MTSTVEAKAFYEAMKHLDIFSHRKKPLILDEVCVRFSENGCTLMATDAINILSVDIPASGDAFDFIFRNTAKVMKACRFFSGQLSFTLSGDWKDLRLTMSSGEKSAEVPVSEADDFFLKREFTALQTYTCNAEKLLDRMKRVRYAAGQYQNARPEMLGFQFSGKYLYCIDGKRLAVSSDDALTVKVPFVIPQVAMSCLKEMGGGELRIEVGLSLVRFQCGNMTALLQRIPSDAAATPERYLPKESRESCTVKRQEYLHELSYLKECAGGKNKAVVHFENGNLTMNQKDGSYRAKVDLSDECRIDYAFDAEMMRQALGQFIGCDTVDIHVSGPSSPIMITARGTGDTALVLPTRYRRAA